MSFTLLFVVLLMDLQSLSSVSIPNRLDLMSKFSNLDISYIFLIHEMNNTTQIINQLFIKENI